MDVKDINKIAYRLNKLIFEYNYNYCVMVL